MRVWFAFIQVLLWIPFIIHLVLSENRVASIFALLLNDKWLFFFIQVNSCTMDFNVCFLHFTYWRRRATKAKTKKSMTTDLNRNISYSNKFVFPLLQIYAAFQSTQITIIMIIQWKNVIRIISIDVEIKMCKWNKC